MDIQTKENSVAGRAAAALSQIRRSYERWVVCAAFVLFFAPSLYWLAARWQETGSYGHGLLVVPLALYFVHRAVVGGRRPTWTLLPFQVVLLVLSVTWAFAYLANVQVVQDALLPLLLLAAFAGLYGLRGASGMWLPVALFVLTIPVWDYTVLPLQLLTARVVELFLIAVDFPVLVEGDLVHVTSGTFEIAGGCSGIRFLLVATILTLTYGDLYLGAPRARLKLVLAGWALALVVNWVRVATVVVIGEKMGMAHPLVVDHAWLGWVLFAVALIPLFGYAQRLERATPRVDRAALDAVTASGGSSARSTRSLVIVLVAMGSGPLWVVGASLAGDDRVSIALPQATGTWQGPTANNSSWSPRFVGANAEAVGLYGSAVGEVYVYANLYTRQAQTAELVGNENSVAGDWSVVEEQDVDAAENAVAAGVIARPRAGRLWLIWYWYEVGGRRTSSDLWAKIYQGASGLAGERRAGLIALATECGADCAGAATTLNSFVSDVRPSLADWLVLSESDEDPNNETD